MATKPKKPKTGGAPAEPAGPERMRLVLENVRCFARAEVLLDPPVTVIIGQNGSGKTTIAEALGALAPGEEGAEKFPLRDGAKTGAITLHIGDDVAARWSAEGERSSVGAGKLFGYGQYRAVRPPSQRREVPTSIISAASAAASARPLPTSLGDALRRAPAGTLFDFDEYLFRDLSALIALLAEGRTKSERAAWERLRTWLAKMDGPNIEDVLVEEHDGFRTARFRRAGVTLPIMALSDGYRAMLAVVLDLVVRYAMTFSHLEDPLAGDALVVIDEIDLNLHPRWQRVVIKQLTDLFSRTRFVLTTHSPAVVQAAIDQRHAVLVLQETEKGTAVRPLEKGDMERLDGAEVDSVAVEVFGLRSRYSPKYEAMEKASEKLTAKVEQGTATAEDRTRLLELLDELQGLMAKDDELKRSGPLMSQIARTQLGMLRYLDGQLDGKKGGPRDPAPAKRRNGAR